MNDKTSSMESLSQEIKVQHVTLQVPASYDLFTKNFTQLLGRFKEEVQAEFATNPKAAVESVKKMEGEQGLMLFATYEHGRLQGIYGAPKKAVVYVLGNPLIAVTMTKQDLRAGLYAPLRVMVYEASQGQTRIDFDLPSSLFGQFKNSEIDEVAQELDGKLKEVIRKAAAMN